MKIFIVDDDIFFLNVLQQIISNLGYQRIKVFDNGVDCLKEALTSPPDVIFLDQNMDTLSGFDVLKRIKNISQNITVVMISGQDNIKMAVDLLKHGAFDYIEKDADQIEKVKSVLERIEAVKA